MPEDQAECKSQPYPSHFAYCENEEEDNLEGLNTGADAYIMKPFNIEILQKTVENLINTRQQLRKVFTGQQNLENKVQKLEVKSPDEKLMERIMKSDQ